VFYLAALDIADKPLLPELRNRQDNPIPDKKTYTWHSCRLLQRLNPGHNQQFNIHRHGGFLV
jgi:hypothetical protein